MVINRSVIPMQRPKFVDDIIRYVLPSLAIVAVIAFGSTLIIGGMAGIISLFNSLLS